MSYGPGNTVTFLIDHIRACGKGSSHMMEYPETLNKHIYCGLTFVLSL